MPVISINEEKRYTAEDYYNTSEDDRVELIDGVFYDMAAPSRIHQGISGELFRLIKNYIIEKGGGCRVYDAPFAVELFEDSDTTVVEPDISVICDKDKLTDRGCKGSPDWIIEIASPGNLNHDYVRKLKLYNKSGVKLYWIVNPEEQSVIVYDFLKGLLPEEFTFEDKVRSGIYEGLEIDFREIWEREGKTAG